MSQMTVINLAFCSNNCWKPYKGIHTLRHTMWSQVKAYTIFTLKEFCQKALVQYSFVYWEGISPKAYSAFRTLAGYYWFRKYCNKCNTNQRGILCYHVIVGITTHFAWKSLHYSQLTQVRSISIWMLHIFGKFRTTKHRGKHETAEPNYAINTVAPCICWRIWHWKNSETNSLKSTNVSVLVKRQLRYWWQYREKRLQNSTCYWEISSPVLWTKDEPG